MTFSGINRLTKNFEYSLSIINDAFRLVVSARNSIFWILELWIRVTDSEAVAMARYLVKHDGLFLGSSSACNLAACVKLVKKMGWQDGQRIVTIL
jgi:cysteine synthase